MPARV